MRTRVAKVTLRYQPVKLPCPGAEPVELFVVHAREEEPPPAVKPLEWFVLTTLRVTSADRRHAHPGQWYALRWRIEEYFRVLKSGCKVEELQHHTAERLERAMAIKMVVGWRIQLMVQLGRETPDLPKRPAVFRQRVARARRLRPLPQPAGAAAPRGRRRSGGPPRRVARAHSATRPARSSCGTATRSSSPWPSRSNCGTNSDDLTRTTSSARRYGARAELASPTRASSRGYTPRVNGTTLVTS